MIHYFLARLGCLCVAHIECILPIQCYIAFVCAAPCTQTHITHTRVTTESKTHFVLSRIFFFLWYLLYVYFKGKPDSIILSVCLTHALRIRRVRLSYILDFDKFNALSDCWATISSRFFAHKSVRHRRCWFSLCLSFTFGLHGFWRRIWYFIGQFMYFNCIFYITNEYILLSNRWKFWIFTGIWLK